MNKTMMKRVQDAISVRATIGPTDIEAVLLQHSCVRDCAVVGKPDPAVAEIPKAYVALQSGAKVTEDDLIKFVADRVAGYKRIREVEFMDASSEACRARS